MALALVVLAHAVAGFVAMRVVSSAQAQQRRYRHAIAFEAAEAGLAESVQWLVQGDRPDVPEYELGDATVEVTYRWVDGAWDERTVALEATGRCRGAVERLELVLLVAHDSYSGHTTVSRKRWRRLPGAQASD
jgi:hypothetical protein